MENNILHKLKKYTALSTFSTAATLSVNADIVYTDIDPDTILHNSDYDIDLNQDGIWDFKISEHAGPQNWDWAFMEINGTSNQIAGKGGFGNGNYEWAYYYSFSNTIGSLNVWINDSFISLGYSSDSNWGYFGGKTDSYIALKLSISPTEKHYGWLRVDINTAVDTIIVKDFAYNINPNESILAGEIPIFADTARNIIAVDISDNINANDIKVDFDKGLDESTIGEYRLMVIPSQETNTFSVAKAYNIDSTRYDTVQPNGNINYSKILNSTLKDKNGDDIIQGENYTIAIFTIPGGTSNSASLTYSNSFVLNFDSLKLLPISNLDFVDAGNNGASSDLIISFDVSVLDAYAIEHRVFAMSNQQSLSFDKVAAYNVPLGNYTGISATGNNIYQKLPITMKDIDGAYLTKNQEYCFHVLSISNLEPPYTIDTLYQQSICINFDDIDGINNDLESNIRVINENGVISVIGIESSNINSFTLYNLNGKVIKTSTENKIYSHDIKKGIYLFKISINNAIITKKIIIT